MIDGNFDKQCAELCVDFLTCNNLIVLIHQCDSGDGERKRVAMIMFTLGQMARAYDKEGITLPHRRLAIDRAERLFSHWFGEDIGRVGPVSSTAATLGQAPSAAERSYGLKRAQVRGFPAQLIHAILGNNDTVRWASERVPDERYLVMRCMNQLDIEEFMRVSVGPGGNKLDMQGVQVSQLGFHELHWVGLRILNCIGLTLGVGSCCLACRSRSPASPRGSC